ncbi:alpha/beta hydrolase [Microbacterium sp. ZW T5_45]|uniref:alpha/beta hydrolase n=1 Tax=Microbacterium sp. ZW T5_45 TaxID=3378080 RepID=UPI0038526AD4
MSAAVLVLPGGGYRSHAPHEAEPIVEWFRGLGLSASVLRYPLGRHPAPTLAVHERIAELRSSGIRRVLLAGFSAGGHVAALAALTATRPERSVDGVMLGYPVVSFENRPHEGSVAVLLGSAPDKAQRREVSAERRVHAGAPPFFAFHARDDETVPPSHSLALGDALARVGVDHELHIYARGGHGGGVAHNGGAWLPAAASWLGRQGWLA